jgi:long-chain acyl-CoA synthetase
MVSPLHRSLPDFVEDAARANPRGIATVFGDERLTWAAFADRVARVAGALRALGVKSGDRVAVLAANIPQNLEFVCAAAWAGAIVVPLNTRLAVPELVWIYNNSEASLLAHDRRLRPQAARVIAEAGIAQTIELEGEGAGSLAALRRHDPVAPAPHELASITYTGGTTGLPKGVMIATAAYAIQAEMLVETLGYNADSVYLHAMPLFHVAGAGHMYGVTRAAATHVFLPEFDPASLLAKVRDEGITELGLVPTGFAAMLDAPSLGDAPLSKIRNAIYGAAPITQTLLRRLMAALPTARFQQFYGQTETSGPCLGLTHEWHALAGEKASKLASAGRACSGFEIGIVSSDGKECARGEAGEIVARGPALMRGYWRNPELTSETIRDGWLHTGDVGVMDADGFVTVVDRLKDMIVTGGENVYSSEVESAIASHPAVAACAVIGVPDERWGEAVVAFVVPRPGIAVSGEAVIDHCRGKIAGYKIPKSVIVRERPLPLSGVGKVQKNVLRAELRR